MHFYRLVLFTVLATVSFLFPSRALAQEMIVGDGFYPSLNQGVSNVNRTASRTAATAPFPFFDDFSNDSTSPDTSLWVSDPENDDRLPTISIKRARKAPSKGVLTFDGATHAKRKHSNLLETNYQDAIVSKNIDLSSFSPSDDLYLSFYYQRGGWGDAPEMGDSLILSFDTTGNGDFIPVWAVDGDGAAEGFFDLVMVPVTSGDFFHPNFRFRFETYGSLNGELDVWNLDYVYFAANRGPGDTIFNDMSPVIGMSSPLGEYTAVPRDFYGMGGFSDGPSVEVSNVSGPQQGTPVALTLSDPVGGNGLTGSLSQTVSSGFLNPYENTEVAGMAFADQAGSMANYGTLRVTAQTSAAGDTRTDNDVMFTDYRVDTILAYDDGQPDAGYGLTTSRSFCMKFRIPAPDTLSGVWIAFTPTLHFNPVINLSTCMDGESFKLTLWDTLAPDSFRTQQGTGMVIQYDSADNYYQRFTFINPQIVDTVFYLGIRQNTDRPLGIGFDKQGPAGMLFYEDLSANFIASSQNGSIMMRPEFGNIREGEVGLVESSQRKKVLGKLYPNPWQAGDLWVEFDRVELQSGAWRLIDLQGREVAQGAVNAGQRKTGLAMPDDLQNGLYLLDISGKSRKGETIAFQKRLVVQK